MTWSSSPVGPSSTSQGSGGRQGGWCRLLRRRLAGVRPLLPRRPVARKGLRRRHRLPGCPAQQRLPQPHRRGACRLAEPRPPGHLARAAQHLFHCRAWWPPVALLCAQQHHPADASPRFGRVPARPQRPLAPARRLPVRVLTVVGVTLLTLRPFRAGIVVAVGATPLTCVVVRGALTVEVVVCAQAAVRCEVASRRPLAGTMLLARHGL